MLASSVHAWWVMTMTRRDVSVLRTLGIDGEVEFVPELSARRFVCAHCANAGCRHCGVLS